MPIIRFLQNLPPLRLWLLTIFISVVMAEAIVCGMELIQLGKVTYDYLLTGLVASFFVAGIDMAVLTLLLEQLRQEAKRQQMMRDELHKSEERTRQVLIATHSALWDYNLKTGRVYLSDDWSQLLGGEQKPGFTTIQDLTGLVPAEERQMVRTAILEAVKGYDSSAYQVTHRMRKLDGSYVWVRSEGQVVERDQNGRALRMIGTNRDISEHKRTEELQKRLIAIIEATPDFVGFADAKDAHMIYINPNGRKMTGIPENGDISRRTIFDLYPEWAIKKLRDEIIPAANRNGSWSGECAFLNRADGREIPILMVFNSHKSASGEIEVFSTISHDITVRKNLEKEILERRKEMEALQKQHVAAQTASAFAHELNQPLLAIASYSEAALMLLNAEPTNLDKIRHAVEASERQALRAGQSIRQLLDLELIRK